MNKNQHLINVFENFKNDENIVFEKLKFQGNEYYFVPNLEGANKVFAIYAIYIEHDFEKAKSSFYKAARVSEFMSNIYDRRVMDNGMHQITYALLSDNKELIERYSVLKNKVNNDTSMPYQYSNSVQNILLEDWDKLEWNIRCLTRFVAFDKFKVYGSALDILNGFRVKDPELITKGLQEFIMTHAKRNRDPLICKFFSIDTAGFCKLAWLKGYEIDLHSSLVPIELMPIRPLDHYEYYDFLK